MVVGSRLDFHFSAAAYHFDGSQSEIGKSVEICNYRGCMDTVLSDYDSQLTLQRLTARPLLNRCRQRGHPIKRMSSFFFVRAPFFYPSLGNPFHIWLLWYECLTKFVKCIAVGSHDRYRKQNRSSNYLLPITYHTSPCFSILTASDYSMAK